MKFVFVSHTLSYQKRGKNNLQKEHGTINNNGMRIQGTWVHIPVLPPKKLVTWGKSLILLLALISLGTIKILNKEYI